MTGLEKLRACMTEFLRERGVEAITAWPTQARQRLKGPVAAVSLRACTGGPAGFRDYLGERYDAELGGWRELYGKRVKVVFGLDIFATQKDGAEGCQSAFDKLAEAIQTGGPQGLTLTKFSRGKTEFDQSAGLFCCTAEAECEAYLYAVADETGAFLDFEVRGEKNGNDGT